MATGPIAITTATTVYADPAMARTFDERRFGGPIGELVAGDAGARAREHGGPHPGAQHARRRHRHRPRGVHARAGGARVTAVDASEEMLAMARQRAAEQMVQGQVPARRRARARVRGPIFDAVVCLRVLMHTPDWRRCVAELCRVADRLVIVDYPSATSAALFESLTRRMFSAVGGRTEAYRVFTRTGRSRGAERLAVPHPIGAPAVRAADRSCTR